jgi:sugar lactone lactonase YvrE
MKRISTAAVRLPRPVAAILAGCLALQAWGQTPPPNDLFANSIPITGASVTVTGSNVGAAKESGEPSYSNFQGGNSVWWSWTAASNGPVTLDTIGSSFDTFLAVFSGNSLSNLVLLVWNDDEPNSFASRLTFTAVAGANYYIVVDGYGNAAANEGATGDIVLHLWEGPLPPQISSQPVSLTALPGSSAAFTVSAMGTATLYYHWMQNGAEIASATTTKYTIVNAQSTNAGAYTVWVTNSVGAITSSVATLTLGNVWFKAQPQNAIVAAGYNSSLSASATGITAVTYQWLKNGSAISGATNSSLTVSNVSTTDAGAYSVLASAGSYQATSSNAMLTVIAPYTFGTPAGQPPSSGNRSQLDGVGSAARFYAPSGLAVDPAGNVYVSDYWASSIRKITPAGVVSTIAGQANVAGTNDGVGTAALFRQPEGIALDSKTNIFVADNFNFTIRKITPQGVVTTFAGKPGVAGYANGPGGAALFRQPSNLTFDKTGNLLVAEWGNLAVRKITPGALVSTLCGGPNGKVALNGPVGIAVDNGGNIYVADQGGSSGQPDRLLKLSPSGFLLSSVAVPNIYGGALDGQTNYYTAGFTGNNTIRRINPDGTVTTLAGLTATMGFADGSGTQARFNGGWSGIAVDGAGNLFVGDYWNGVVRQGVPFALSSLPLTQGVPSGTVVTLGVSSLDTTSISCQWLFNGTLLSGETNSTLGLRPVTRANTGTYSVRVSTSAGNWITLSDTVRALVSPVLQPPQLIGSNTARIFFEDCDGGLPFDVSRVAVQWRTNLPSGSDTNWQTLNSTLLRTNGFLQATDTNAPAFGTRYYRIVEQ